MPEKARPQIYTDVIISELDKLPADDRTQEPNFKCLYHIVYDMIVSCVP